MDATPSLIPTPGSIILLGGKFAFTPSTRIVAAQAEVRGDAEFLARALRAATGFPFEIAGDAAKTSLDILLALGPELQRLGPEAYRLLSREDQPLTIQAAAAAGIGHGIQTLLQLLPPAIYNRGPGADVPWVLPRVEIEDSPRFAWRGAMLDCARHFMPVEFIKKFIDLLALHKLNTFHWHLTEDQGWRLEIKKYPRLTEIGSRRRESTLGHQSANAGGDGIPHGGFYTQQQARAVVAYAAERHINVVPEIEMPGHAQAAIAAYPELGCTGEKLEVGTRWGVIPNIFNPAESTFRFLEDVLAEVIDIFPSPWIHIGGDEAIKTQWEASPEIRARMAGVGAKDMHELQSWFIRRIGDYLASRGRRLVGWDEIMEGGLAPNATVMSWRGAEGGIEAARLGHNVVMAPNSHTYLDKYQSKDRSIEPLAIGGYLPLETIYQYEPIPEKLDAEQARQVLGAQCQIWTEYIATPGHVEYMAFPRLAAFAEAAWSSPQVRNYANFRTRLPRHLQRLNVLDVRYRPPD
jgi:hexosaminidase